MARPSAQERKSVLVGKVLENTLYLPSDARRGRLHARLMDMTVDDLEFLLLCVEQGREDAVYDESPINDEEIE